MLSPTDYEAIKFQSAPCIAAGGNSLRFQRSTHKPSFNPPPALLQGEIGSQPFNLGFVDRFNPPPALLQGEIARVEHWAVARGGFNPPPALLQGENVDASGSQAK